VTGEGIELFLRTLGDRLRALSKVVELRIPFDRGDVLASVHREGEVVSTTEGDGAMVVRARPRSGDASSRAVSRRRSTSRTSATA
jgi:GTPase